MEHTSDVVVFPWTLAMNVRERPDKVLTQVGIKGQAPTAQGVLVVRSEIAAGCSIVLLKKSLPFLRENLPIEKTA